jgi:hypothetical protein
MIENEVQTDVHRKLMDHAAPIDNIIAVLSMAKVVCPLRARSGCPPTARRTRQIDKANSRDGTKI